MLKSFVSTSRWLNTSSRAMIWPLRKYRNHHTSEEMTRSGRFDVEDAAWNRWATSS